MTLNFYPEFCSTQTWSLVHNLEMSDEVSFVEAVYKMYKMIRFILVLGAGIGT